MAALACLAAAASAAGGPADPGGPVLTEAADWLHDQRGDDGCLDGHRSTSWATVALTAGDRDPHEGEPSLVDGLREACPPDPSASQNEVNTYARHVLALVAAGEDPRSFDGRDWVEEIRSYHAGGEFVDPGNPNALNDDAFAILALRAAGVPTDDEQIQAAADTLLDHQNDDGGWPRAPTRSSETGMTAAAVEALTSADRLETGSFTAKAALAFLADRARAEDGCFAWRGSGANVFSTAWAIRALPTLHADPREDRWTRGSASAWDCLREHRRDDGAFEAPGGTNWTTWEAIPALAGVPHGLVSPAIDRPSASLSTPSQPEVGETTTLRAEGAAFAGWQLPDGKVLEGAETEWTPQEAGEVEMSVLLVGEQGTTTKATFATTVEEASEGSPSGSSSSSSSGSGSGSRHASQRDDADPPAPDASIEAPASAERNVSTSLQVEAEPARAPVTVFRLELPDGGRTDWQPAGTFDVELTELGERTVRAWARDADGHVSDPVEARIPVVDAAPRIELDGPTLVNRSTPFEVQAHAHDPDGPPPNVTWTGPDDGRAEGREAVFSFPAPGAHTIEAQAVDRAGGTANASLTVHARNRAPTNLTIEPAELPANASETVHARVHDPDGDALEVAWRAPGGAEPSSWGRQLHVETGPSGQRVLLVNVSDPYGGWTTGRVELPVREQPADEAASPVANLTTTATPTEPRPSQARPTEPARVELPGQIRAEANASRLLHAEARSPNASVLNVTVALGGPLPVRGTGNVTAIVPGLPPGEYELAARAADRGGWGPWTNATLIVEPVEAAEPLEPASTDDPRATPIGLLAVLTAIAAAGRGRP
jgi:hypothetical protein